MSRSPLSATVARRENAPQTTAAAGQVGVLGRLRRSLCLLVLVAAPVGLAACNNVMTRLSDIGNGPQPTPIQDPTLKKDYRPVSMPMPQPNVAESNPNSLWRPGARAFFKDQRAAQVGDILTVLVNTADTATLANATTTSTTNSEGAGLPNFLGIEGLLHEFLPSGVSSSSLVNATSSSGLAGSASIKRGETVSISLAAVVLQVLPNGNLVIAGRQEMRVNTELRELTVTGVIRPQDITSENIIQWNKIAEARISYGGRGVLSNVQQERYGQQIFDILFPF